MNIQEHTPIRIGGGHLPAAYPHGFNYATVVNASQIPPIIEDRVKIPQVVRSRVSSTSPMRFCVQTKDRFVVRVVKIAEKKTALSGVSTASPTSTLVEPLKSVLHDPQKMQSIEELILEAVRMNSPSIYIGFQAQLPAIALGYVLKSTSADQVNAPNALQAYRQCRLGKGVRLCFSCPLLGKGLNIRDFFSGKVYQRLTSWEKSSRYPGILNEVLQALKKSVDWMLEQIQLNGLRTVLPEVDYIFYPCAPPLLSQERASRQVSMHTLYQGLQQQQQQQQQQCQNPLLASVINSSRPLSAYGTCFDGKGTENAATKSLDRQISFSTGAYGSPLHHLSEYSPYASRPLRDLQQHSTGTSSINSISHTDYNEASAEQMCVGPSISVSASPPGRWASNQASPIYPAPDRAEAGKISSSSSLSKENDFMIALINEVVDRLRKSPHLPLVVMPTQTPGSPPIVFQLPSPDVIFVGLPATLGHNGHERPRLVTSPADSSAFVVTSKRSTNSSVGLLPLNFSPERQDDSTFTVSAPHPGCILGVSPEGDLYEFKPS
ncbi:hypothetical protein TcWFU_006912 [Taenia crassiceps]|uniref:Uncharacterized protein n=1 Tax=Taenia crassiceps TaxID=6207 RepID=A0ABR4QRN9_9CEST